MRLGYDLFDSGAFNAKRKFEIGSSSASINLYLFFRPELTLLPL